MLAGQLAEEQRLREAAEQHLADSTQQLAAALAEIERLKAAR